jgi:hypothetical protein
MVVWTALELAESIVAVPLNDIRPQGRGKWSWHESHVHVEVQRREARNELQTRWDISNLVSTRLESSLECIIALRHVVSVTEATDHHHILVIDGGSRGGGANASRIVWVHDAES